MDRDALPALLRPLLLWVERFGLPSPAEREQALLIDRLSGRLGRESVVRAVPVADAQPEYAYRYEPLAGRLPKSPARKPPAKERAAPAKEQRPLPERPLLLEPRPIQLEVLAVAPEGTRMRWRSAVWPPSMADAASPLARCRSRSERKQAKHNVCMRSAFTTPR